MDRNKYIFSYVAREKTRDVFPSPYFTKVELPKSSAIQSREMLAYITKGVFCIQRRDKMLQDQRGEKNNERV